MRALLLISVCFFFTIPQNLCRGQVSMQNDVLASQCSTADYYKYQQAFSKIQSQLSSDTSSMQCFFSFTDEKEVVDLWQNAGVSAGIITFFVREVTPGNEPRTGRSFLKPETLDSNTAGRLMHYVLASGILAIPTDDSIPGWGFGDDGVTYTMEFSTPKVHHVKNYWSPYAQHNLHTAAVVQQFTDSFLFISNIDTLWGRFRRQIPFQCYFFGLPICCKSCTKKQRRTYYQERQRYRKSKEYLAFKNGAQ